MTNSPRVAITMGDPAGIGPEICLKMLQDGAIGDCCLPLIFGDVSVLGRVAEKLSLPMPAFVAFADTEQWSQTRQPMIVDFQAISAEQLQPGIVSAETGKASIRYVDAAIDAAMRGNVDAICTGPIHKEAINLAGFHFPGHTELLADRTGTERAVMMLTCQEITCSFVTTHVGYTDVPSLLTVDRVRDTIMISARAVSRLRGRPARVVVCALNPHAGEHGLFGNREEERIIEPAINEAREQGIEIEGPLPPDTAFLRERRAVTDLFVCMYHDQGHIPLKALAFDVAVNVSLGLPIVRTSVDHGTASDIAWQGVAEFTSLTEAVRLAAQLAGNRQHT